MKLSSTLITDRSVRRPTRKTRLCLNQLEARELPSGTPLAIPTDPGTLAPAIVGSHLVSGASSTAPTSLHDRLIAPVTSAEVLQDNGQLSHTDVIKKQDVTDVIKKMDVADTSVRFIKS